MNTFDQIYLSVNLIIWTLIPIRQFKQKTFYFFLILCLGDLATAAFRVIFHSNSNVFYVIFAIIRVISIYGRKNYKNILPFILTLSAAAFFTEYYKLGYKPEFILISLCNLIIFFDFLKEFIIQYSVDRIFNLFLAGLIFYQILAITKFLNIITTLVNAGVYFNTATMIQMLIGIEFCLYKENSLVLQISME